MFALEFRFLDSSRLVNTDREYATVPDAEIALVQWMTEPSKVEARSTMGIVEVTIVEVVLS